MKLVPPPGAEDRFFITAPRNPSRHERLCRGRTPRLASQTSFAWRGLLSARVPPATPGLPFLPPPLPSGPARSPGLGILGQPCVPLAAGRSCAGRAAGALLSLDVSGGAVTASPSPPRGWHTGGAARCSLSQGLSSRVLWGADLLLPPSVLGPLCSLRDRLLSLIFTLFGPFTQHVARLHRREGIRPGLGSKQAGVGAVLQGVVRKALSFSPETRRQREGSAQLFGDHNPGRGTSRRRARRWRCPPATTSQELEEQSPAADMVGREACGETGPGGLGSGEAARAEGWASAWSQTGA